MTGIINRVPAGLLDLLDMKSRGQTPRELDGRLQSVADIIDLYCLDRIRNVAGTSTASGTVGLKTCVTVPQQEWWWIWKSSVQATGSTGAVISIAPGMLTTSFPGGAFWTGPVMRPYQKTGTGLGAVGCTERYWVGPGDALGAFISESDGTSLQFLGRWQYVPFEI